MRHSYEISCFRLSTIIRLAAIDVSLAIATILVAPRMLLATTTPASVHVEVTSLDDAVIHVLIAMPKSIGH